MKKLLIFGSFLALAKMASAQTPWYVTGNSPGASDFLGTNNVRDLVFKTSGSERIRIQSGGNVGIGTSSPSNKLEIWTATAGDGVLIKQTSLLSSRGSAALHLDNSAGYGNGGPGKRWALMSTGPNDYGGEGNFYIYDWWGPSGYMGTPRFCINGGTGYVGIGTVSPGAALHVTGDYYTNIGIKGDAISVNGIGIQGNNTSSGNQGIGVQGNGEYGVDGIGNLVGVRGHAAGTNYTGTKIGVRGSANMGATNYAGLFTANGVAGNATNYGIYTEVYLPPVSGSVNYALYANVYGYHTGGSGPNYAGYFNGDVVTAGGNYFYSDKRIKKDIFGIENSLSLITKLNPVNYNFDSESNPDMALPQEKQYGFLSQEVQQVIPEFTKTLIQPAKLDEKGNELFPKREVLGLNYIGFIALLTKGIQEQQIQIEGQQKTIDRQSQINADLQKQLDEQKQMVNNLSHKVTGIGTIGGVETGFNMSQNEPNPFTHETVVKYTLPQTINNAFMAVYDLTGKQITTFPIRDKGTSSITITSQNLAAGIYIYSIVADGKVVDSKRMIVADK